jgi:hypothetical protein
MAGRVHVWCRTIRITLFFAEGRNKTSRLFGLAFGPRAAAVALDDEAHVGQADARALELTRAVQPRTCLNFAQRLIGILHQHHHTMGMRHPIDSLKEMLVFR